MLNPVSSARDYPDRGRTALGTLLLVAALFCAGPAGAQNPALPVQTIRLPPGFAIEVLVDDVPNARAMAWGTRGTLFVGSMRAGKVYAVRLRPGERPLTTVVASGLDLPVGVAFRDGSLFVSAVSRILRFDDIEDRLDAPPKPVVVSGAFPRETHHGWKFIAFGPDGWLYVPVGAPCNICLSDPDRYANIMRLRPDGAGLETYARGVRNTVGFDWHPVTKALWFTDNGRDLMGDDLPDDELNVAPRAGLHFGYPYCHQGDLPDPEFGSTRPCKEFTAPVAKLGPHVAALGMRFYTGALFPADYRNNIFIAEHGSWNRSKKIGYRVKRVVVDGERVVRQEVFAEGWLQAGDRVWGRPVDVLVAPDGALLVSDDYAGAIYRISYRTPAR
ncbi:MAG: PQQ-dependent sugar dehydrogenase [Burkholderiales bacterium]